ncbi:MAG: glycogen synthase GlgA [Actinomycetota bacterium]
MRILFVSAEVAPFSKTGGLADVAAALPAALQAAGHDLAVVSPLYQRVRNGGQPLHRIYQDVSIAALDGARFDAYLAEDGRNWLIEYGPYFDRAEIYSDRPDEHRRFLFLTHAALELCRRRGWPPDIVHGNDWQSGFLPLYVRSRYGSDPTFSSARTVLTIHNLGYQGIFGSEVVADLALGDQRYLLHQEHLRQGRINFLEHAFMYADLITTVSPTYAWEIQTPELGMGLDTILRRRSHDLVGILNGIDPAVWNPRTDHYLAANYSEHDLEGKAKNKAALLERGGIDHDDRAMLIGVVSRLTAQKGIELMIRPLAHRLSAGRVRLAVLGSGETKYEEALQWLASSFPGRVLYSRGYDEPLAHLIEAGADVFLMPSRYEPSGLNQMYSLAYGTPPVVRKTGGLADTVSHYDPVTGEGTGFVFEHFSEDGLAWALDQALAVFPDRESWRRLQRSGMAMDNSWDERAGEYDRLYHRLTGTKVEET